MPAFQVEVAEQAAFIALPLALGSFFALLSSKQVLTWCALYGVLGAIILCAQTELLVYKPRAVC
jgi:hypothetical protein